MRRRRIRNHRPTRPSAIAASSHTRPTAARSISRSRPAARDQRVQRAKVHLDVRARRAIGTLDRPVAVQLGAESTPVDRLARRERIAEDLHRVRRLDRLAWIQPVPSRVGVAADQPLCVARAGS
jgi:hypothetical protein